MANVSSNSIKYVNDYQNAFQVKIYEISESKIRILELYTQNYPVLPEDTYLILGDKITGSLDSTSFGLIHKDDILGIIITENN